MATLGIEVTWLSLAQDRAMATLGIEVPWLSLSGASYWASDGTSNGEPERLTGTGTENRNGEQEPEH